MRSVITANTFNNLPLNRSEKKDEGFYCEILQAIEALLGHMIQSHNKVFFIRLDLTYPAYSAYEYPGKNDLISRFIESLSLYHKRKKHDPKYLWVRERSSTGQVHYHLMLLLNGDYVQNAHGVLVHANNLWQRCLNVENAKGLVHLCTSAEGHYDPYGGVMIKRNATEYTQVHATCFERASYLAKRYSKGGAPAYVNEFGCSRLS